MAGGPAAEDARRRVNDNGAALRQLSSGSTAEIERLRLEERVAEQTLQYLRSETAEAHGDVSKYRVLGHEAESEARAEH